MCAFVFRSNEQLSPAQIVPIFQCYDQQQQQQPNKKNNIESVCLCVLYCLIVLQAVGILFIVLLRLIWCVFLLLLLLLLSRIFVSLPFIMCPRRAVAVFRYIIAHMARPNKIYRRYYCIRQSLVRQLI